MRAPSKTLATLATSDCTLGRGDCSLLDRPPSPAAVRARQRAAHRAAMRRHRRREKDGVLMVTVPVTPEQTGKLVALRYLAKQVRPPNSRAEAAMFSTAF